jgi:hypothetical protein
MKELIATPKLSYKEMDQSGHYEVWEKQNQVQKKHRTRKYVVTTDLTNGREDYSCICVKFNKDDILCSHILKILVQTEVSKIPEKYIIERWRKKDRKMNLKKPAPQTGTHDILRHNILSREATVLTLKGARKVSRPVFQRTKSGSSYVCPGSPHIQQQNKNIKTMFI